MPHLNEVHLERNNFYWLLAALLILMFSSALAAELGAREVQRLSNLSLMVTLLIGVWTIDTARTRILNWKVGATFLIGLIMIADTLIESNFLAPFQLLVSFLFLSMTFYQVWQQVMFTGQVDTNKIVGAICMYLLLGLLWAVAYLIIEELFRGSFNGLPHKAWQLNLQDMTYYSFVTLTTLGYGDVTPAGALARFFAYMQAIVGIFYTTVLVASLIGIRLAGVDSSKPIEKIREEALDKEHGPDS